MPNTAPVTSPRLTSLSDPNETKISCLNDTTIQIDQTGKPQSIFTFDHVFYDQQRPTQRNVYDLAAKTAVMEVLRGYNGTIFAYGQTGSGKSYSMFGPDMTEAGRGIIPRACSDIFDYIAKDTDGIEFTVKCGFLG
jgi:kinesin family protein 5